MRFFNSIVYHGTFVILIIHSYYSFKIALMLAIFERFGVNLGHVLDSESIFFCFLRIFVTVRLHVTWRREFNGT